MMIKKYKIMLLQKKINVETIDLDSYFDVCLFSIENTVFRNKVEIGYTSIDSFNAIVFDNTIGL